MIPQNSQISVALDDQFRVETVELNLLSNTLCVAYRVPRSEIASITTHSRWATDWKKRLAVYVLLNDANHLAYIGETENLLDRINHHVKKEPCKDWTVALIFCDSDGKFLERGKLRFLELSAWEAADAAHTYALTNPKKPDGGHVIDRKGTLAFLDYMKALTLPLGAPYLFSPIGATAPSLTTPTNPTPTNPTPTPPKTPPLPTTHGWTGNDFSPAAIFAAAIMEIGTSLPKGEIEWLQTDDAKKALALGYKSLPPLKLETGNDEDFKADGLLRYFPPKKCHLAWKGKQFRISHEGFARKGKKPTYDWAISHGLTDAQIAARCVALGFRPPKPRKKTTP